MKIQEKQNFGLKKIPLFYAMNSKKIQTGIDELACSINKISEINKNLREFLQNCNSINTDNSNWCSWKNYTITKIFIPKGFALYISYAYQGKSYNLGCVEIWEKSKKGSLKSDGRIVLYGTLFRIEELKGERFDDVSKLCEGLKVCILDIKIDYFLKKGFGINNFKENDFYKIKEKKIDDEGKIKEKGTKICKYIGGGKLESMSIGEKEEKRIFIRIYDKKLDLEKKKKECLYKDYFDKTDEIVRVEYRLMSLKLKKLRFEAFRIFYKNFLNEVGVRETQYKPALDIDLIAVSEGVTYFQKTTSSICNNIENGLDFWLFMVAIMRKKGKRYILDEIQKFYKYLKNLDDIDCLIDLEKHKEEEDDIYLSYVEKEEIAQILKDLF